MKTKVELIQKLFCQEYNVPYCPSPIGMKIGITLNVRKGVVPINGLRHPPEKDTTGWYIWGGEYFSNDPNFFIPLHVEHISEWCPQIEKFLGLPPGWRFLIAGDYEDVWFDETLLDI